MNPLYDKFKHYSKEELHKCFEEACKVDDRAIITYLLTTSEFEIDIHHNDDRAFKNACFNGHLELVKYLAASPELKEHANIHSDEDVGFRFAACEGHLDIVRYLLTSQELKTHSNINAKSSSALEWAVSTGQMHIVDYLLHSSELKEHADVNQVDIHVFTAACGNELKEPIKYLMTSKEFQNHPFHSRVDTAFINLCKYKKMDLVHFLIFEANIPKNKHINKYLSENPNKEVENWFNIRDFKEQLVDELLSDKSQKTNKRNKI